jgi:hypothetical protein
MIFIFNQLSNYKATIDVSKRQIKFIINNIKCCLIFTSSKSDIDYIKQIRVFIGSNVNFIWIYNSGHPYLSKQECYDYVSHCIITNIMYYV